MNSRALFIVLFCGCVFGACQGEEESSSILSTSTSNTTSWGRARPHYYPHMSHLYPSSHARSYPGRFRYPPSVGLTYWSLNSTSPFSENSTYRYRSSSSEYNTTIWLSELQFLTRTELSVDINLPRIAHTENCTFITPDNKTITLEQNNVTGVNMYGSNRSEYVSCRIVVGPMEESLIGKWTICGSYTEDNVEHRRCQRANIAWRNSSDPSSVWQTTIQAEFKHVVYFRGILSPSVRGFGHAVSCHLVTPKKEDLLVTRDSEYPNIKLVQDTGSVCSIAIGPIGQSHLGSWTIYGIFNTTLGFNEVRLPMKLDLYNKNRPYDQAYNVTTLNPIEHIVSFGKTVAVEVASTGGIDVCIFTTPSGMSYNTIDPGMPSGVVFINDNRVACQISIGPITQEMIGTWMLIGRFSNHGVYTQMIQWFNITLEGNGRTVTEVPNNFNTEPTFQDWGLNMTTITPLTGVHKNHLHSNMQSDRVLVEMPGSLAMDQDLHFAMSLVPMLRQRSLRDKLDVQMNVLYFFKSELTQDQW